MAKQTNRNLVFKIINQGAETLEMNEIQTIVNSFNRILKGGDYVGGKGLEKGMKVESYWPEDGSKATGSVKKVERENTLIAFDDGETWYLPNSHIIKAWHEEKVEVKE